MKAMSITAVLATVAGSLWLGATTSRATTPQAVTPPGTPNLAYAQFPRGNFSPDVTNAGSLHVVTGRGDEVLPVGVPATAEVAMNTSGEIAFTGRLPDGSLQVYTVSSDGNDLRAVTPPGYRSPVWSPDGSRIAVTRIFDGSVDPTVAVVDVRDRDKLTTLPVDQTPGVSQLVTGSAAWAPDGSKLAFTAFQGNEGSGGTTYIHIANADGSGTSTLTSYGFAAADPGRVAWSPDGLSVAFSGGRVIGGVERYGVFVASVSGALSNVLFADDDDAVVIDSFSPDGRRILAHDDGASPAVLSIPPTDGATRSFSLAGVVAAGWAADGERIVYCQQTPTANGNVWTFPSDLYLLDTATGATSQLTSSQQACDPSVQPRVVRYAGATRVETSISLSRQRETAPSVVIARSDLYPDALAAAPLAAKVGGSLLLSPPSGLTSALKAEVKRLGARMAYVIGDTTALSAQVDTDLRSSGISTITRIGGATRYETAALIAELVGGTHAFIARGDNWPDAASVSQLAAATNSPILLTPSSVLDPAVSDALAQLRTTSATIVGGPAAIKSSVESAVNRAGVTTSRLAGADRFATSVAVVEQLPSEASDSGVTLVSGLNWPDAIAAGPSTTHPMVLVDPTNLADSAATKTWLLSRSTTLVVAVGGPDVVAPNVTTSALTDPLG